MEKHVGLNPAWFEPGPDGESPFVRKYNASPGTAGEAISAAFRALLAQDAAQEVTPPALGDLGKVVQVPEMVSPKVAEFIQAKDAEIARLTEERDALFNKLESRTLDRNVYALRCTDKDEEIARMTAELHARNDEIVGLLAHVERLTELAVNDLNDFNKQCDESRQFAKLHEDACAELAAAHAEVERLKSECSEQQRYVLDLESAIERKETRIKVLEVANDSLTQYSSNLAAERDALRARIEAGRVMYGGMYGHEHDIEMWTFTHVDTDTMTALLIDARPIAAADERKGERRKAFKNSPHFRRKTDRRSTPGTRADRGE